MVAYAPLPWCTNYGTMRSKSIDYDALLKEFISDFFPEFMAFTNPALYAAIDWDKGYEFLEQELINAMRGRFKVQGKRKKTDKLVKVGLKTGTEHYVYVHGEFQHKPEAEFPLRMYNYRALIGLRYGIESITSIALFTGAIPAPNQLYYSSTIFGTSLEYKFNCVIANTLAEQALIAAVDNPFAAAMLAAQYAYRSRNDAKLRLELKTKLFDLLRIQGDLNLDRTVKLFIFVRDFVHLPKKLENEFQQTQFSLVFPNEAKMIITQGTKDFAIGLYERVFGYNPLEEQKKTEAKLAKERQKAEEERLQLQAALQREEEERQRTDKAILYLYQTDQKQPAEIAMIIGIDQAYVEALISKWGDQD